MDGLAEKTMREDPKAIAWDNGCVADPIRNEFLVPTLADIFGTERPTRILDIGTGTGYIPRAVDMLLDYRPNWTLVDINGERIRFAKRRKPPAMRVRCLTGYFADTEAVKELYDAVMLTFTLLEIEDASTMLATAIGTLSAAGLLVIAVPDVWRDVLEATDEVSALSRRLLSETINLPKIDKFTGNPYPFYAMRTESLISTVLSLFCTLERLEKGGDRDEVYLLVFRKRVPLEPGFPRD